MRLVLVVLAGGLGAVTRYLVDRMIAIRWNSPFPLGTLMVNVTGSGALGALTAATIAGIVPVPVLAWGGVGFLGAYTTFSTFTFETLRLLEDGAWAYAAANLVLSGPISLAAAAVGYFAVP